MTAQKTEWQGKTDGSSWMHKSLAVIMKVIPLSVMYSIANVFVVPFYAIFSKSKKSIYNFYRYHLNYTTSKALFSLLGNFSMFSKNILDKFRMFSGGKFDFEIENYDYYKELAEQDGAFMIFSAHVGNYELAGYTLKATSKPFNVLLYGGEAETIMHNREKMFAETNIKMIPVKDDMSHLFALNNALENGESVSIPADRIVGNQKCFPIDFLNQKADFPAGPFLLAAKRKLPTLAIHVMKISNKKYKIYVKKLLGIGENASDYAKSLLAAYRDSLEEMIHKYPLQWFNFYEFWNQTN